MDPIYIPFIAFIIIGLIFLAISIAEDRKEKKKHLQPNFYREGGYLFAGDFYKNITATAVNPDNAYAVRHGVELTF